jgi:hypothetical protein
MYANSLNLSDLLEEAIVIASVIATGDNNTLIPLPKPVCRSDIFGWRLDRMAEPVKQIPMRLDPYVWIMGITTTTTTNSSLLIGEPPTQPLFTMAHW